MELPRQIPISLKLRDFFEGVAELDSIQGAPLPNLLFEREMPMMLYFKVLICIAPQNKYNVPLE